jgi:hypothetical protein
MSPAAGKPLIGRDIDPVARARGKAEVNDALRGFVSHQSSDTEPPRDASGRFRRALSKREPKSDIAKKADDWIRGKRG